MVGGARVKRGLASGARVHRASGVATIQVDSEGFEAAHRRLLADESLQFDLPVATPDPPPAWLEPLLRFMRANAGVLEPLFYLMLAAFGAWLAWLAGRALYERWRERAPSSAAAPEWRPEAAAARRLLEEADALANAGRYGEAARLLLGRSIEDIDAHRPDLVRPASTAREIGRAPAIPTPARTAFATIAAIVERSLFARRPLDAGGWGEARDAYRRFAIDGSWA